MHQPAGKETLAQWVSLALRKALSPKNIKNGFATTGIWPLNHKALDGQFAPSRLFEDDEDGVVAGEGTLQSSESESQIQCGQRAEADGDTEQQDGKTVSIEDDMAAMPSSQVEHFFVDCDN